MSLTAQYGGRCDACQERIVPGQPVRYDADDELVHAGCADVAEGRPVKRPVVVCTECWLQKPCPCDDGQGEAV